MDAICPRCRTANRTAARFCARCGLGLQIGIDGTRRPGRIRDARPVPLPPGMLPIDDAANLYFRWESAFGGQPVLGTEGVQVIVFNAGYALRDVALTARGEGRDGRELFVVEQELGDLPRGGEARFEIGSYLFSEPLRVLRVALGSAEFAAENE